MLSQIPVLRRIVSAFLAWLFLCSGGWKECLVHMLSPDGPQPLERTRVIRHSQAVVTRIGKQLVKEKKDAFLQEKAHGNVGSTGARSRDLLSGLGEGQIDFGSMVPRHRTSYVLSCF